METNQSKNENEAYLIELLEGFGIPANTYAIRDFGITGNELLGDLKEMANDYASEVASEIAESKNTAHWSEDYTDEELNSNY